MGQEIHLLNSKILGSKMNAVPLLICHGVFGMLDNWQTLGARFAEKRPVHLLDLRNHGRSFHHDQMSYKELANDIKNYLDHHQITTTYLLGHSMGGKVAMNFAINYPDFCSKLIVADIAPKPYPPHHQSILKGLNSLDFSLVDKRSDADKQLQKYISEIGVRQFLLKNVIRKNDGGYGLKMNLKAITLNYESLICGFSLSGKFDKETLFLKGGKSEYITKEDFPSIKMFFPNSRIEKIENAGHWLHAENPNAFFTALSSFLEK